ncbi:DUF6441 family protein [Azospirillum sp. ST 5-10]|uniref:DUF6441 family protein n=1 Tax=unclassified Azospirillum TaxID=2630922 RepID=UPI003F4A6C42
MVLIVGRIDGDLRAVLDDRLSEIADAARAAVSGVAAELQADLRAQVRAAGLGEGLEKAWRLEVYPKARRRSFRPASLVYSNATRLHAAFDAGPAIRAKNASWLAIPLPAAVAAGLDRQWGRRDNAHSRWRAKAKWSAIQAAEERFGGLRFVPINGNRRALLVADGKARGDRLARGGVGRATSIPLFLLVRQTKLPKRLDLDGAASRAEQRLASRLSKILPR